MAPFIHEAVTFDAVSTVDTTALTNQVGYTPIERCVILVTGQPSRYIFNDTGWQHVQLPCSRKNTDVFIVLQSGAPVAPYKGTVLGRNIPYELTSEAVRLAFADFGDVTIEYHAKITQRWPSNYFPTPLL